MIEKTDFINKSPGLANIKDLDSKFLAFSEGLAKLAGWRSSEAAIGKTDYDNPCPMSEFASEFIKMDKKVIASGKKMIAIDIQNYSTGWGIILAEKVPITNNNGDIIAIYSPLIDVSAISMFKFYLKLHEADIKWIGKGKKPVSYILSESHSPFSLTEKQENCLFHLVRGKTIKEISKILKISPRTVECHLDAIKLKYQCNSKAEIIEKAIDNGFLFYIPKCFQHSD